MTDTQERNRCDSCKDILLKRPHSKDWKDVVFYDELHFGIGPQLTKHVKRQSRNERRNKAQNIHRKRTTFKDTKVKARETEPLKLLNIFVVIRYTYKKIVPYEVPNGVRKMTTKVYTDHILPSIRQELSDQGLTLCQDADSAHCSHATLIWMERNSMDVITLPRASPDLSILESIAQQLKRKFYAQRTTTQKAALARFEQVFEKGLDHEKIQELYSWFTKRLHDCDRLGGKMTIY